MAFNKVNPKQNFPELEEEILKFWEKNKTFKKSVERRPKEKLYSFFDGPPYATGTPHYGHILAGTMKDVIPRYWTMKGYRVERRFGWDCHGLPVEYEKEKELGLKSKKDIEEMGVAKFNEACRSTVLKYVEEWKKVVTRSGRWVDFENDYKTMNPEFMESVWWVFKELWDRELIYEGFKVSPYCPRCATPLSNFETAQGYADKEDVAITVKFRLEDKNRPNTYFLAWTTTPWTLPGNLALAVNPEVDYVEICFKKVSDDMGLAIKEGESYILAVNRIDAIFGLAAIVIGQSKKIDDSIAGEYSSVNNIYELSKPFKGKELEGLKYEPIFPYYKDIEGAYRVVSGDFVSTEDGTGIVHIAPSFGEDDYNIGKRESLEFVFPVKDDGTYSEEIKDYKGLKVYDITTNAKISDDLAKKGLVIKHEHITHSYPFCWRCETALIYKTVDTWFVDIQSLKKDALSNLLETYWVPMTARNRMEKMIEAAPDWNITRNRFWGTPIPVWKCDCGEVIVIGNIKELEKLSGKKVNDLHKHFVDKVEIKCECGGKATRTPEILDVWFDSGSMPYASHHYPFSNKKEFESKFPADFIAEGIDQTRGWFYTLMILATAIFEKSPYKNVVVNGTVLAEDGKKMSKRLKNYPEPDLVMHKHGADAMRFYLMNSPAVRAEDLRFSEKGVDEVVKKLILTLWNSYSFFVTYAYIDKFRPNLSFLRRQESSPSIKSSLNSRFHGNDIRGNSSDVKKRALLDRWIISKANTLIKSVTKEMDAYDLSKATRHFWDFIDELSNWYIRRSRRRFWKSENDRDKLSAYQTLYEVLVTISKLLAPFMPFVSEAIYKNLTGEESVHLSDWPEFNEKAIDKNLEEKMVKVREIVERGLSERAKKGIKVRQPLSKVSLSGVKKLDRELEEIVKEELNVKKLELKAGKKLKVKLDTKITKELRLEGIAREIVRRIQAMRKEADFNVDDRIKISLSTESQVLREVFEKFDGYIRKETLAEEIEFGEAGGEDVTIEEEKIKLKVKKV